MTSRRNASSLSTLTPQLCSAAQQGFKEYLRLPSLYDRLSLTILLAFLLATYMGWQYSVSELKSFVRELDQRFHLDIAVSLQEKLTPHISPSLNKEELRRELLAFERSHPRFHVYLLDKDGNIIVAGKDENDLQLRRVYIDDIEELSRRGEGATPRLAQDPLNRSRLTHFSSAAISTKNESWYIYAVPKRDVVVALPPEVAEGSQSLTEHRTRLLGLLCIALILAQAKITSLSLASSNPTTEEGTQPDGDSLSDIASSVEELARSAKRKAKELQRRNEERSSLISGVAPDLRRTLGYMNSLVASLRVPDPTASSEEATEHLSRLSNATELVIRTVSQILEITKYESISQDIKKEPFLAFDCLQDVQTQYATLSEKLRVNIVSFPSDGGPIVWGDIELIRDAYGRLVHNALVYSLPNRSIHLNAAEDAYEVHLSVEDRGVGISSHELEHVTERLFRGANAPILHVRGEGLGLYIAKKVAEAHGGRLTIVSKLDEGTTATLSLPKNRGVLEERTV